MSPSKVFGLFVFSSIVTIGLAASGCAANTTSDDQEDDGASSEADLSGPRSVALKYEGTCAFLKNCSSYSRDLPANKVTWGCSGVGICSDTALWVAGPNRSYCGKSVRICKGSQCTSAVVKDVSVSRNWEASNGVLDALDLPHGFSGKCSGYGGGRATVTVGTKATITDPSGDDEPPPATGPTSSVGSSSGSSGDGVKGDNGCLSATLGEDVPELTCVMNTKGVVFQCKAGLWYRGVDGTTGPYGECLLGEVRVRA